MQKLYKMYVKIIKIKEIKLITYNKYSIKIYNDFNDSLDNITLNYIIFTLVCATDLIYLTYGSFEEYCWRVKQYKKLLNRDPIYNEWIENGNQ